jgi:hypothetical protein
VAIQDPPVVLTTKLTGKFDTDRFRHYTKSGSTVDYVVWPVLFLHEGGPIICKGVAQGADIDQNGKIIPIARNISLTNFKNTY